VVEDNAADVYLLQKALHRAQVSHDLYHFADGEAALHFFLQEDDYRDAPHPDLLVLDLHLPRVDGPQVLQRLRESNVLPQMPVIALTSSTAPHDRALMEALDIDYYIVKSFNLDGYMHLGQLIKEVLTTPQKTRRTEA
jgi:CheY-like chemotaxis protein